MRKLLLGVILFSLSGFSNDFVYGLPNGHYAGNGNWEDNYRNTGSYSTYVEIRNNEMRVDYGWDGQSITLYLSFWFHSPGAFDVVYHGGVAGQGYCELNECYYEIEVEGLHYWETLSFNFDDEGGPTLSKIGQKKIGDRIVTWEDGLFYINLGETDPIVLPVPDEEGTPAQQK